MKYLKRKFIALRDELKGNIVDTTNVENKKENAPSVRLMEEMTTKSEVLWENPNPAISFPAQTVQLKTNNYSYFRVIVKADLTREKYYMLDFYIKDSQTTHLIEIGRAASYTPSGKGYIAYSYRRQSSCTQNQMYFGDFTEITTSNPGEVPVVDNEKYIPIKVIGYNL